MAYGITTDVRNPNLRGITAFWLLIWLFSIPLALSIALSILEKLEAVFILLAAFPLAFVCMIQLIAILFGRMEAAKAREFLQSSRPILRWTYRTEDWNSIMDEQWADEKDDWKLQLFGLTFIFGLVGVLVGIMGMCEDTLNPLVTTTAGVTFGIILGVVIATGNYIGARREYSHTNPAVAIGESEIFYNSQYFKADGRTSFIRTAEVKKDKKTELVIRTYGGSFLTSTQKGGEWIIPIPRELIADVEAVLPRLKIVKEEDDEVEDLSEDGEQAGG